MKKHFLMPFIFVMMLCFTVSAEEKYPLETSDYEVSFVCDDGTFSFVDSFDDFDDAVEKMKENRDYVVRHKNSPSPMKIIAMNSGVAYTYPARNGNASTMKIYEDLYSRSSVYKSTYLAAHYEMEYKGTELYFRNGTGMIRVNAIGFEGYTDLEYTDLIPAKILELNVPVWLGGCNYESLFLVSVGHSYYEAVENGNYIDLKYVYYRDYPKSGTTPLTSVVYCCPAYDFMETGVKYYSENGIDFYFDIDMKDYAGTGHNYYEYLPLRSRTDISADVLNSYISKYQNSVISGKADLFINAQEKYGVNALILFSMAIHESAYGTSNLAVNKNNLFGWNAVDASPESSGSYFSSVENCINEQAAINLRGYLDISDWRFFGSHLGNKESGINVQYASDPYWGIKIGALAYRIDKSSKNFDGTLTDYGKYTISVITRFDTEVRDSSGSVMYTTSYGGDYQRMFTVIDYGNGKVQSTNAIEDGTVRKNKENGSLAGMYEYSFDDSVGYINPDYLRWIAGKKPEEDNTGTECSGNITIKDFSLTEDGLHIAGTGNITGTVFKNRNIIKQTLILEDYSGKQQELSCDITDEKYNINDGNEYLNVGFDITVPYEKLNGSSILKLKTSYGNMWTLNTLRSSNRKYSSQVVRKNGYTYRIFSNQLYGYRFETDVFSSDIDWTINKPSSRASLISFDSISVKESENTELISVEGQAMIYYLDYSTETDYGVFLLSDDGAFIKLESSNRKCDIDYSEILNIKEDSSFICFSAEGEVPPGEYSIIVIVENGEYRDVLEMTNRSGRVFVQGENLEIKTDSTRNRVRIISDEKD